MGIDRQRQAADRVGTVPRAVTTGARTFTSSRELAPP